MIKHIKILKQMCCFIVLGCFVFLQACSSYKTTNNYLLKESAISKNPTLIETEKLKSFIKQIPNDKFFNIFPLKMWIYNVVDPVYTDTDKLKRDLSYDEINKKRIVDNKKGNEIRLVKGKKPKEVKLKDKESLTWRQKLLNIGEAPVYIDSALTQSTTQQLNQYLFYHGYFNTHVFDSTVIDKTNKSAKVYYNIKKSEPYKIDKIIYKIKDGKINNILMNDSSNVLLKPGIIYNEDIFQTERERQVSLFQNNGYYFFDADYIQFNIDSALGNKKVIVREVIENEMYKLSKDSIISQAHQQYVIKNIYCTATNISVDTLSKNNLQDTLFNQGIYFINHSKQSVNCNDLRSAIKIKSGLLYHKDMAINTYRDLNYLQTFKSISINFQRDTTKENALNCFIICTPAIKQSLNFELEGNNTSGNLGMLGSIIYQNKNLFRGAELIEVKLRGSAAIQKIFDNNGAGQNNIQSNINTFYLGPELNVYFPKTLFPFNLVFKNNFQPKTFINSSLNYQSSFQFSRVLANLSYGFRFSHLNKKWNYEFTLLEAYFVNAFLNSDYRKELESKNNFFLLYAFQDHFTVLNRFSLTYNNQTASFQGRDYQYFKISVSSSGSVLNQIYSALNMPKNKDERYTAFGVPFSHFIKFDLDYRFYHIISNTKKIVIRTFSGIGKAFENLTVLPYEQSFFCGGANGLRAWQARNLGPGSYDPQGNPLQFDKIGDIQLELNIEYRFKIYKWLHGAAFVDIGNVWKLTKDPSKLNSEFELNRFYKELGVGPGIGARFDFDFFVLRLDYAMQLHNPKFAEAERWQFNSNTLFNNSILNFAIGYPF